MEINGFTALVAFNCAAMLFQAAWVLRNGGLSKPEEKCSTAPTPSPAPSPAGLPLFDESAEITASIAVFSAMAAVYGIIGGLPFDRPFLRWLMLSIMGGIVFCTCNVFFILIWAGKKSPMAQYFYALFCWGMLIVIVIVMAYNYYAPVKGFMIKLFQKVIGVLSTFLHFVKVVYGKMARFMERDNGHHHEV